MPVACDTHALLKSRLWDKPNRRALPKCHHRQGAKHSCV